MRGIAETMVGRILMLMWSLGPPVDGSLRVALPPSAVYLPRWKMGSSGAEAAAPAWIPFGGWLTLSVQVPKCHGTSSQQPCQV